MKQVKEHCNNLLSLMKEHPIATTSIAVTGITVILIGRYHNRFLVHPNHQGRHNHENAEGLRHPSEKGLESEDIQILTDKCIQLRGWYVKHPNPSQIIIYFHSNSGNIGKRLNFLEMVLKNTNSNILLVAFRGFSDSDGKSKPKEKQILIDACTIFRKGLELAERQKLPLFVFGRGLGGAVAIHVLSQPQFRNSAKGLIVQNTFTKLSQVAENLIPTIFYPIKWLVRMGTSKSYLSIKRMQKVNVPVLFIKGRKDEVVPTKMMDQLQNVCLQSKKEYFSFEVKEGTHRDTWQKGGQQYYENLINFMDHCSRI